MVPHRFSIYLILFCAATAGAQATTTPTTPPPVKMGLWETSMTSQMSGFSLPPDVVAKLKAMGRSVPGGPHTTVSQGCLTPEEWQKDMADMNKPAGNDCAITNRKVDSREISFDISCKSERGDTTGHWEMHLVDDEHGQGLAHMNSNTTGPNGRHITMDMNFSSRFLSSSCGDVKPGNAKIIRHD
ncbi:MAG: DUF3617 domain-containing protein [Acidobacteriaceae bacterium]